MKNVEQIINHYRDTDVILWKDIECLCKSDQVIVLRTIFKGFDGDPELTVDSMRLFVLTEKMNISKDVFDRVLKSLVDSENTKKKP